MQKNKESYWGTGVNQSELVWLEFNVCEDHIEFCLQCGQKQNFVKVIRLGIKDEVWFIKFSLFCMVQTFFVD